MKVNLKNSGQVQILFVTFHRAESYYSEDMMVPEYEESAKTHIKEEEYLLPVYKTT